MPLIIFQTPHSIVRDFDRKLSRRELLEIFELEEKDNIFFKGTSVFIFKILTLPITLLIWRVNFLAKHT